jgi:hypothetical protein
VGLSFQSPETELLLCFRPMKHFSVVGWWAGHKVHKQTAGGKTLDGLYRKKISTGSGIDSGQKLSGS